MRSFVKILLRALLTFAVLVIATLVGTYVYFQYTIYTFDPESGVVERQADSRKALYQHKFIAHALGGIDGHTYTNSREAFLANYAKGFRLFEVDLYLTDEGSLICFHSGQEKHIGYEGPITALTRETFLPKRYHEKYTPLDFQALLALLKDHEDAYLVLDPKTKFHASMQAIVDQTKRESSHLLDRMIPQIYREKHLNELQSVHRFPTVIYTLYREKTTIEKVSAFVRKNEVTAVAFPASQFKEAFARALLDQGVLTFVFTANNPDKIKKYFSEGVSAVYTDFYFDSR